MSYVYCYAPLTGSTNARTHYCNGDVHKNVSCIGGTRPLDIMAGGGTTVRLYVSHLVPKIRIEHCSGVCRSLATPWTYGMKVTLYYDSAGTQTLGVIGYGHVENRKAAGLYNNSWGMYLGTLPTVDCNCTCYNGHHVHMQSNGTARAFGNCSMTPVSNGGHWIYRWLWPV